MPKKVFIIAEAGVNHNGSLQIAKRLIDVALRSGADAVKFQSFNADRLLSRYVPKAAYQKKTTQRNESQFEMIRRLELSPSAHKELFNYCRRKKITFLSSPFDLGSIDLLDRLGLRIFKIPSGEITNLPYLRKIAALHKQIIISTGMADLAEIGEALKILVSSGTPKKDITVLHCNTEYPSPLADVNLKAMLTIRDKFAVSVGYSDHTLGIEVAIAAVALGASVIEKHFTLNKKMSGPDQKASLEPGELKQMVDSIRNIEIALGCGKKRPSRSEIKNIPLARRSIVAAKPINKGEIFTDLNIIAKRPGFGISPMSWDKVLGRKSGKVFLTDDFITL